MASGIEVAKAFVTIVPSLEGSQSTITTELTGITNEASSKAGTDGGSNFGSAFATAIKGTAVAIGAALTAATAAAVGTAKAFVSAANDVSDYGDEVDKMSQKLGFSTDSYQKFDYVLKISGTEMSSMTTGIKTLTNKLDDAKNGSEDAQAMFAALGLSMEELSSMSREDIFDATIRGFQGMEDSTERAALANDLFGKSGQNLTPLFNMTSEEMDGLMQKTEDLGMVMSEDAVKDAAAYKDAMTTLDGTLTGLKNSLMSSFMPGLTQVIEGLSLVFSGQGGIEMIQQGLTSVIGNIVTLAPQFFELASTIVTSLLSGFAKLLPSLIRALFLFINQGLKTVVSLIPELVPVLIEGIEGVMSALFDALPLILDGLMLIITELVTWLSAEDNVKTFIDGLILLVTSLVKQFSLLLPVLIPAIVTIIGELANALSDPTNVQLILDAALTVVGSLVVALIKALPKILEVVIQLTSNVLSQLATWGKQLIAKFGPWFTQVLTKIGTFCTSILTKIKTLPTQFTTVGKNLITGLWNGISNKVQWLKDKISELGTTVTSTIKKKLGIKSPSRLWRDEIGSNLALGLGEGFTDTMKEVEGDMVDSMDGLTGSMSANITANGTAGAAELGNVSNYNGGNISINVYGAQGQNVDDLAKQIAYRLEEMTRRKEAVYG